MFLSCYKNTNLNFFIFKGYLIENIQLLTVLQFDFCYAIKTRVGFEIEEMTRFLNYIGSYSFAMKCRFLQNILFQEFARFSRDWNNTSFLGKYNTSILGRLKCAIFGKLKCVIFGRLKCVIFGRLKSVIFGVLECVIFGRLKCAVFGE